MVIKRMMMMMARMMGMMRMMMAMGMVTSGGLRISSSKPGGVALSTSIRAVADLQKVTLLIQIHKYTHLCKHKYKYYDMLATLSNVHARQPRPE